MTPFSAFLRWLAERRARKAAEHRLRERMTDCPCKVCVEARTRGMA